MNLTFVPLGPRHESLLGRLWADPAVIRYSAVETPCTLAQARLRLRALLEGQRRMPHPLCFAALAAGTPCGMAAASALGRDGRRFVLFYQFLPSFWGKGIATETVRFLLGQAAENYPGATVYAHVVEKNEASRRLLCRLGFQRYPLRDGIFARHGEKLRVLAFERPLEMQKEASE